MGITVYEKPRCTTCQKLVALLEEHGVDADRIDYQVLGLTEQEVRGLLAKTGVPARDLLRMREPGAKELAGASEDAIVAAMVEHPALLQRPVVVNGARAVLARPIERALEVL